MDDRKTVVVCGGGTGGHVFPAIAVMEELGPGHDYVWLGGAKGIEATICLDRGIPFIAIPSGKLRRYFSWQNFRDIFLVIGGIIKSFFVLARLRPAVVFSKGGFVSVPPVFAARVLGIPVVSHESDYDPGLATRLNTPASRIICVPWEESREFFAPAVRPRVVATGNPVRREIFSGSRNEGLRILGFDGTRPILFVQGGSLGAGQLNDLVDQSHDLLCQHFSVVHQRGRHEASHPDIPGVYLSRPFFSTEFTHILAATDLVLARAGAGTLWEMAVRGKPGILLPLSAGSRGDQVRNARFAEELGACLVLPQDGTQEALEALVAEFFPQGSLDRSRLDSMAGAWARRVPADGAARVAAEVRRVMEGPLHGKP